MKKNRTRKGPITVNLSVKDIPYVSELAQDYSKLVESCILLAGSTNIKRHSSNMPIILKSYNREETRNAIGSLYNGILNLKQEYENLKQEYEKLKNICK